MDGWIALKINNLCLNEVAVNTSIVISEETRKRRALMCFTRGKSFESRPPSSKKLVFLPKKQLLLFTFAVPCVTGLSRLGQSLMAPPPHDKQLKGRTQ